MLDSGSAKTAIPGALEERLQPELSGGQLVRSIDGNARVVTAFGAEREQEKQIHTLHLVHGGPWGDVRIALPLVLFRSLGIWNN